MHNTNPFAWHPTDGATIHFRAQNLRRGLASGRYRLERQPGPDESYWLHGITTGHTGSLGAADLQALEQSGHVTPISPDELERERQEVQLRTAAPLRQSRRALWREQHDASDLALFRAASEPRLAL